MYNTLDLRNRGRNVIAEKFIIECNQFAGVWNRRGRDQSFCSSSSFHRLQFGDEFYFRICYDDGLVNPNRTLNVAQRLTWTKRHLYYSEEGGQLKRITLLTVLLHGNTMRER